MPNQNTTTTPDSQLLAALAAAEAGYPVHPCRTEGSKAPALKSVPLSAPFDPCRTAEWTGTPAKTWADVVPDWLRDRDDGEPHGGFLRATLDPDAIRELWSAKPGALPLAAVPPGCCVIDVDTDDDGAIRFPADLLQALQAAAALVVRTPSGGLHLHFRAVREWDMQWHFYTADHVRAADFKPARKGYVFVPGGRSAKGEYTIVKGRLDAGRLSPIPDDLIDRLKPMYAGSEEEHRARAEGGEKKRRRKTTRITPDTLRETPAGSVRDKLNKGVYADACRNELTPERIGEWRAAALATPNPDPAKIDETIKTAAADGAMKHAEKAHGGVREVTDFRYAPPPQTDWPETPLKARPVIDCNLLGFRHGLHILSRELRIDIRAQEFQWRTTGVTEWRGDNRFSTLFKAMKILLKYHCAFLDEEGDREPARFTANMIDEYMAQAAQVDPFHEYLRSLEWDNTPRLDKWIETCLEVDPRFPRDLLAFASSSTWRAAAARAGIPDDHHGVKYDHVVILSGPQNLGKSTLVEKQLPPLHRARWYSTMHVSASRKKMLESILGKVITGMHELVGATKADLALLKDFVTTSIDSGIRLAYARDPSSVPRRAVIIGTYNPVHGRETIPFDPTGSRRFIPVPVTARKKTADGSLFDGFKWMDDHRDLLWAEAYARRDERLDLTADQNEALNEWNATHAAVGQSAARALFRDFYNARDEKTPRHFRYTEVTKWAADVGINDLRAVNKVNSLLQQAGCTRRLLTRQEAAAARENRGERWFPPDNFNPALKENAVDDKKKNAVVVDPFVQAWLDNGNLLVADTGGRSGGVSFGPVPRAGGKIDPDAILQPPFPPMTWREFQAERAAWLDEQAEAAAVVHEASGAFDPSGAFEEE